MRFAERWPASDARVRCACGHAWTPSGRVLSGVMRVTCAKCDATLAVFVLPPALRVVAQVEREEWRELDVGDVRAALQQLRLDALRVPPSIGTLRAAG